MYEIIILIINLFKNKKNSKKMFPKFFLKKKTGGMLLRGAVAPHLEEAALEVGAHGMVLSSCIFRGFSRRVTVAWSDLTNIELKKSVMVNGGVDQQIYGVLEIRQGVCVCVCVCVFACV